ncbi:hypothetical protein AGLY_011784 [Aphis glycines]|uniref:Uncharacterized protein n=1 Tax=Aphis glycines TaxID=307491 RepID=A0A6G0TC43_APHGL|nr:hypothetical protein AGLY_011784 [Aphis glycines]
MEQQDVDEANLKIQHQLYHITNTNFQVNNNILKQLSTFPTFRVKQTHSTFVQLRYVHCYVLSLQVGDRQKYEVSMEHSWTITKTQYLHDLGLMLRVELPIQLTNFLIEYLLLQLSIRFSQCSINYSDKQNAKECTLLSVTTLQLACVMALCKRLVRPCLLVSWGGGSFTIGLDSCTPKLGSFTLQ